MSKICRFSGEHAWLSNFYPVAIILPESDLLFPSVEHAYQAAKCANSSQMTAFTFLGGLTPGQAKRLGRKVRLIDDWESLKLPTMYALLAQKFTTSPFQERLLATGDAELVEENNWGDTFWGVCNGVGENNLGRLIMKIRKELTT